MWKAYSGKACLREEDLETREKGERKARLWFQRLGLFMTNILHLDTRRSLGRRVCTDGSGGGHRRRGRARAKRRIRLECRRGR